MEDAQKTKRELLQELARLRQRLAELEEAHHRSPATEPRDKPTPTGPLDNELERYRNFVENAQDGCFEVDLDGTFIFINAAMASIHGYRSEELIGMNYRRLTTPKDAEAIYRVFNLIYRTGEPAKIIDYSIIQKKGAVRNLEVSATLIRDTWGTPVGFRGISRDITDRKKAEAEKARLSALLNQAQRLEAVSTLAAGVAHNFNNLLMSLQGFVSLMRIDLDRDHPHYSWLETVEDLINRGSVLTTQLLGYARHGRHAHDPVDIKAVLRTTVERFKKTHRLVGVRERIPDPAWPAAAHFHQLESVFMNLFTNSAEAMHGVGSLTNEVQNVMLEETSVRPYGLNPGPYLKVKVSDTGAGMDPETLERAFEPFFSTKNISQGAGLGLSAVYGVVKSYGGFIQIESEIGKGTAVTIFLPAIPPDQDGSFDTSHG